MTALAEREVERRVPDAEKNPDTEKPFFLSYAHTEVSSGSPAGKRSPGHLVSQFFDDLSQDVAALVDLGVGADMGFMDDEALRGGEHWHPELIRELGTCRMLITLLSVPALKSDWCGKEWHAFLLREKELAEDARSSPNQGYIIPVRWAPIAIELPAVVKDEQIFKPPHNSEVPELPGLYRREGILGLLRRNRTGFYEVFVWELAMHIQRIYFGQRLPAKTFEPDELKDVFQEAAP
jgi:hypothetical protein